MGDDDYCPQCFECDGECINGENGTLVCESCGHVYTNEEWDEKNDKEIAEYVAFLKGLSEVDGMRHKIVQVGFLADKGEELIKLLDDGWKILTSTYVGDNIEQMGGLVQYVLRKEVAE